MELTRRPMLSVERLEQRDCPSFVIRLADGTLFVTGSPAPTGTVSFTQTANNRWQVKDGTANLGTYSADNVNLSVTQHNGVPIIFDLGSDTSTGSIMVNLGNGDHSGSSNSGLTVYDGQLNGTLTVLNGSGEENVMLGYKTAGVTTALPVTIAGNVNVNLKEGATPPNGNIFDTGTEPGVTPTVVIGGSLTTTGVNAVQLQTTTTVGQNVSVTTVRSPQFVTGAGDLFFGTVDGNVTIHGAASSSGDVIQFGDGFGDPALVGGNLYISLGNGNNQLEVSSPFTVNGSTNIQMGDGNNAIGLGSTVAGVGSAYNGSVNVQLGNGNNTDGTAAPAFFTPDPFFGSSDTVSGNFTLTAGNGANNFTTTGNPFAGVVTGNTAITLGSGSNSEFTVSSANLGGVFNWHSGNGNDSLTFAGAPAPTTYNVNAQFGNLDDVFTFNNANSSLTGRVDGGGHINGNLFNFLAGTIEQPFTLSNFP